MWDQWLSKAVGRSYIQLNGDPVIRQQCYTWHHRKWPTVPPTVVSHAPSNWLHMEWVPSLISSLHATCCSTPPWPRPCRTSISRMSSKEKICLHEREKHPPPALPSSPAEDEEEEGQTAQSQSQSQAKASSSSSSEEESESESDAESGRRNCWARTFFIVLLGIY